MTLTANVYSNRFNFQREFKQFFLHLTIIKLYKNYNKMSFNDNAVLSQMSYKIMTYFIPIFK